MPQGGEEAVGLPTSLAILVRVQGYICLAKYWLGNRRDYNLFPLHEEGEENEHTNNVSGHYFIMYMQYSAVHCVNALISIRAK